MINPLSFHRAIDLDLPWRRLAPLCAAVLLAGVAIAPFSARHAAERSAALSVREDW